MSAASTSTSPASGASAVSDLLATTTPDGQAERERRVERAFGGAGTATIEAALVCFGVAFYLGAAPAGASFLLPRLEAAELIPRLAEANAQIFFERPTAALVATHSTQTDNGGYRK